MLLACIFPSNIHSKNQEKKLLRSKASYHMPYGSVLISGGFKVFFHENTVNSVNVCPCTNWLFFFFLISEEPLVIERTDLPHSNNKHVNILPVTEASLNLVHMCCTGLFNTAGHQKVDSKPPLVAVSWISQCLQSPEPASNL